MECKHANLASINGVITCQDCGAVLPPEFVFTEKKPEPAPKRTKRGAKKNDSHAG